MNGSQTHDQAVFKPAACKPAASGSVRCGVAASFCGDYAAENVKQALDAVIGLLGGMSAFIRPGARVAIKPNLVTKAGPDQGITTHPAVVGAVAAMVRQAGGRPFVVDTTAGMNTDAFLHSLYRITGMEEVMKPYDSGLVYDISAVEVANPSAIYLKRAEIIKPLVEADAIINIPKLKTHWMMGFSCAVKNMFGAVPGLLKPELHLRMPSYDAFADALIDTLLAVKPVLNIVDAIVSMEGDGPVAGELRQTGLIFAGSSAFDVDIAVLSVLGIDPMNIWTARRAFERGLGPDSAEKVVWLGPVPADHRVSAFRMPQLDMLHTEQFFARGFLKPISKLIKPKPVFKYAKCTGCGECMRFCPAKVIEMRSGRPVADLSRCIRCFCCQEFCPSKAVVVRRRFPFSIFSGGRKS